MNDLAEDTKTSLRAEIAELRASLALAQSELASANRSYAHLYNRFSELQRIIAKAALTMLKDTE